MRNVFLSVMLRKKNEAMKYLVSIQSFECFMFY